MIAAGTRRVGHVEKNDQTGKWPAVSRHLQTGGHKDISLFCQTRELGELGELGDLEHA